jgi:predicted transglutaminase-like cysteine proteinase
MWLWGLARRATRILCLAVFLSPAAWPSIAVAGLAPGVVSGTISASSLDAGEIGSGDSIARRARTLDIQAPGFRDFESQHPEPFTAAGALFRAHPYRTAWESIRQQVAMEQGVLASCRAEPEVCPLAARRFLEIVEAARAKQGRARLGEVNRAINLALKPTKDLEHHGARDVWSTPLVALSAGRGDCEDYAIAKYVALHEAGVPASDLRFVVVHDTRLKQDHAVVAARLAGRWLVLDNVRLPLLEEGELPDYIGLLSLDDKPQVDEITANIRGVKAAY